MRDAQSAAEAAGQGPGRGYADGRGAGGRAAGARGRQHAARGGEHVHRHGRGRHAVLRGRGQGCRWRPADVSASQPESGRTEVGPDGTLVFVADEPGLQAFQYAVLDGRGGSDSADATVFVNPLEDALVPPAMARVAPADLPAIAQACATGIALETTRSSGPEIQISGPGARPALPDPGRAGPADPAAEPRLRRRDLAGGRRRPADRHARRQHGLRRRLRGERPGRRSADPVGLRGAGGRPATSCSPACSRSP